MSRQPYLVQRMSLKARGSTEGIDALMGMSYMGSAEFEFGALPASLKRMTKDVDSYDIQMHKDLKRADGASLCTVAMDGSPAIDSIRALVDNPQGYRLKESTYLEQVISGKSLSGKAVTPDSYSWVDAWWDIDNDIMFCFGKDLAKDILKAIVSTRDRKKAGGAEGWY